MKARSTGAVVVAASLVLVFAGCRVPPEPPRVAREADPGLGRDLIERHGCGECHVIPGVRGADGLSGPPLEGIGSRSFIAGRLSNSFDNMALWVRSPQDVDPGNAMPDVGLSEQEARHVAAYLLTLR